MVILINCRECGELFAPLYSVDSNGLCDECRPKVRKESK